MNFKKHEYQEIIVEISDAEAAEMIEKVARFIAERHLASAGIMMVESLRPLHSIGSQLLYFVLPFAEVLFDSKKYQQFALMLEKEEYVKELISRMDELDEELNRDRRQKAKLLRQRRKNQVKAWFGKVFRSGSKKDN